MGYANPFERFDQRHGENAFVAQARDAGVDGVLVVDYPPEECEAFAARLQAAGLDPIFLLAPTSTEQRMKDVGRVARGYVYYVSLKGVTGAGHLDTAAVAAMLPRIRAHVKAAAGRRLRHPRRGHGVRGRRGGRRGRDRLQRWSQLLEPQPRDNVARAAGQFIAGIRAALDARTGGSRT